MARPSPTVSPMMAPFFAAAQRGELIVPECDSCHRRFFEPEAVCPRCLSAWHWESSPGIGTLYSFSIVHRGATPAFEVPYTLALIELDDDWMMLSNLVRCREDQTRIGMRVEVEFRSEPDGFALPYFRPAAA
jgi:uncharacterized protein